MITINDTLAPVLVAAIRDAYRAHAQTVESTEVGDVSDIESGNQQMIPYWKLWPQMLEPPPGDRPELKLTD